MASTNCAWIWYKPGFGPCYHILDDTIETPLASSLSAGTSTDVGLAE